MTASVSLEAVTEAAEQGGFDLKAELLQMGESVDRLR